MSCKSPKRVAKLAHQRVSVVFKLSQNVLSKHCEFRLWATRYYCVSMPEQALSALCQRQDCRRFVFGCFSYWWNMVYLRLIYRRLFHNDKFSPNLNRGFPKSRLMSCKRPEWDAKLAPGQLQFDFDIYKAEVLVFLQRRYEVISHSVDMR